MSGLIVTTYRSGVTRNLSRWVRCLSRSVGLTRSVGRRSNLSHPTWILVTMTAKRCPRCDRDLPLEVFDFRDAARTSLQSYCRDCAKAAWRDWYSRDANRELHRLLVGKRRRARIKRHREIIRSIKQQPCADCGKTFPPEAMDFDHLREKRTEVSRLLYVSGTAALLAEIEKCEVVCANCHRVRTMRRLVEGIKLRKDESESR